MDSNMDRSLPKNPVEAGQAEKKPSDQASSQSPQSQPFRRQNLRPRVVNPRPTTANPNAVEPYAGAPYHPDRFTKDYQVRSTYPFKDRPYYTPQLFAELQIEKMLGQGMTLPMIRDMAMFERYRAKVGTYQYELHTHTIDKVQETLIAASTARDPIPKKDKVKADTSKKDQPVRDREDMGHKL
ncbi:hypothetical protein VTK56DRAFT_4099 [Thermocarpiscus australiensis]